MENILELPLVFKAAIIWELFRNAPATEVSIRTRQVRRCSALIKIWQHQRGKNNNEGRHRAANLANFPAKCYGSCLWYFTLMPYAMAARLALESHSMETLCILIDIWSDHVTY